MTYQLKKVISGGQTGADQAGLIAAHKMGITTGGTAPSNFYTEGGANALLELLGLTAEGDYRQRTVKNVKDSDGTVLITITPNSPGSILTRNEAKRQNKPFFEIDLNPVMEILLKGEATPGALSAAIHDAAEELPIWMADHNVATLNVAGNREKHKDLSSTKAVVLILTTAFKHLDMCNMIARDSDFF